MPFLGSTDMLLADLILVAHTLFVAFVVLGQVAILLGGCRRWRWVRNLRFRVLHLVAVGYVVAETWLGLLCPLTEWENRLRAAAGGDAYAGSFIGHWLHEILYYDFAPWVFIAAYTVFGILVLSSWWLVRPENRRNGE